MSTSTSTGSSTTNLYLDKNIMEVFEEKEDIFSFPLTTFKQARDFVKVLDRRGCPYDVLCRELHEDEENFRDWRLGGDKPDIGKNVIDRINKPFQETMFSVSEKDDKDPRNYTFKDFYQQFSVDEEKASKKSSDVAVKSGNTNSAVINGRKADSVKLPSILVKEPSVPKSPESGVDAKQLKSTPNKPSSSSLSPSSSALSPPLSPTSPSSPKSSSLSASTSQLNRIKDSSTTNLNKSQSSDSVTSTKPQETKHSDAKTTKQQKQTAAALTNPSRETSTKLDSVAVAATSASTTPKSSSAINSSPQTSTVSAAKKTSEPAARKTSTPSSPTTVTSIPSKPPTPTTKSPATTKTTGPSVTTSAASSTTAVTTTPSPKSPTPSTPNTTAKPESASTESEEAERPPSPITTSPHYQPFVHSFSTDDLLPMINYNSDDDEASTSTTKDEPGYIYLLSDIPSGNLAISKYTKFRVRISCSKFPEKRLRQAILFNPDIKMIGSIKVPLMKKSLNDARQKLKSFILKNKVDWYWGTLNGIFGAIESAL